MNSIERIICFIGGADLNILKKCPTDKQKFIALGIGVLNTSILSMFTMGYAIYSIVNIDDLLFKDSETFELNPVVLFPIIFTLFWGGIIFGIDWGLISTIHKKEKYSFISGIKLVVTTLFRLLVTLVISFTVSKPLEVIVFKDYLPVVRREMQINFEDELNEKNETEKKNSSAELSELEQQMFALNKNKQDTYKNDPIILELKREKNILCEQYDSFEVKYNNLNEISRTSIHELNNLIDQISVNSELDLSVEERERIENNKQKINKETTRINDRLLKLQKMKKSIDQKQKQIDDRLSSIDSVCSEQMKDLKNTKDRLVRDDDYLFKIRNEEAKENKEISEILNKNNFINNIVAVGYIEKWKNEYKIVNGKKAIAEKISFISILLTILIVIIDTAPIIIKLLMKRGCYEEEFEKMERVNNFKRIIDLSILEKTYPSYANSVNKYNIKMQELKNLENTQYEFNEMIKLLILSTFNDIKSMNKEFNSKSNDTAKFLLIDFQNKLISQLNITKDKMFDVFKKFVNNVD